jgi:DNA polymerase III subunit gamma/tau
VAKKPIEPGDTGGVTRAPSAPTFAPADPVRPPMAVAGTPEKPYVVLARKYRPRTFEDMIGQDALVQTLRNAFASGRIAQGYMLTGVRGIGKTTTARILARGLNYATDTMDRPTVDMPGLGRHCAEIMESRHPDIIEMDAASNTGIDDIREIIENARYKPIAARYKVFIIDEVHMLSKSAFNGLLKTLEEPPEHVKFIFATTEIRKVPVTILSRCQRFDLRRVDVPVLIKHFQRILGEEGASAEDDAVRLIARAAEGSVRDGLSILDQSIAMGSGEVKATDVRAMLGLADRSRIFDLLELTLGAKPGPAIQALAKLHQDGAEPLQVLADLGEAVHLVTRTKIVGVDAAGESLSAEERARSVSLAGNLSVPILARAWQMLVKGLEEAGKSGNPLAAAEMVLIRLAYTADLPSPDEVIRGLGGAPARAGVMGSAAPPREAPQRGPLNSAEPQARGAAEYEPPPIAAYEDYGQLGPESDFAPSEDDDQAEIEADIGPALQAPAGPAVVRNFGDVVDLASRRRDPRLKVMLEENVSLVRFDADHGLIDIHLLANAPKELGNELREKLNAWTDRKWMVALAPRPGEPAIGQVLREQAAQELEQLKAHPAVAAVMRQFPQAKISTVKVLPRTKTDESAAG